MGIHAFIYIFIMKYFYAKPLQSDENANAQFSQNVQYCTRTPSLGGRPYMSIASGRRVDIYYLTTALALLPKVSI